MVSQHNVAAAPMTAEANLREQVQQRLRLDIVSGEVGPGTILSVPGLARTLGISTTPVREALLQLSDDGLLQPLRNRGFCVVEPTLEDLRNLFEVRLQLETSAFVKLVRSGLADVAELTRQADEIARAVIDVVARHGLRRLTHRKVAEAAGVPLGSTTYHFETLDDLMAAGLRGSSTPLQVVVGGPDYERIKEWSDAIVQRAEENPGLLNVDTEFEVNQP